MKNSWQILTLLLAVALVALSFKVATTDSTPIAPAADRAEVGIDIIMTRSSIRSYTKQRVDPAQVEILLKAGMAAPTAGNRQPWDLVVITDREILDAIPAFIPHAHMATKAQCAIAVCGTPSRAMMAEYWVQDCSAVTENILLAAHAMGLGAVWCGAYPNNDLNRIERMRELLSIPDGTFALSVIMVGHPDVEAKIKNKWDPAKVHYNKF